ncbi:MAG: hypothetical protein JWM10_5428 [Myxococcaceae bacterium]|nr:hypothetical protein [Myxococcaceae bacterium]
MISPDSLMQTLEDSDNVAYVVTPEGVIGRTNPAWRRFASANGGGAMAGGAVLAAVLPAVLRAYYVDGFARALATGEPWEHDYECSSAETFRRFRMVAYPFDGRGLVVVNSLRLERPHEREAHPGDDDAYTVDGVITMCSHCRRLRRATAPVRWDWVPAYVRSPPDNLSHGLCASCYEYYWGDLGDGGGGPAEA